MGRPQPTPVVRLRHKVTGRECWFINVHNAPGYHIGQQQATRDRALALQAELIEKLRRETGLPVILTGDMNDKVPYRDGIAKQADMHAANDPNGPRPAPASFVDWIFGSADVAFSRWRRDASSVQRRISDHGMLASEVRLG